jgi:1-acyl-sn-glycerol-3-phosphate acyltransferase
MSSILVWLACAVGCLALLGAVKFWRALKRIKPAGYKTMREFADQTTVSGFLPPPPSEHGVQFLRTMCGGLVWVQLGKVKVVNPENLTAPGPYIITPNHGSSADPALFPNICAGPMRYMAAKGVFQGFGNWLGYIIGASGGFCADLNPGQGGGAREAAVEVLTTGQNIVMFPEGWAWLDGGVRPFKKGAVRIAKAAAAKLGQPCYLIPSFIRYGAYPGKWILRFPPPVQYLLVILLAPVYRRGVTVVMGKPISTADLPADDAEATEYLRNAVIALDPKR